MDNDRVAVVLANDNLSGREKFAKVDGTLNFKNYNGLLQGVYGSFGSTNTSEPPHFFLEKKEKFEICSGHY